MNFTHLAATALIAVTLGACAASGTNPPGTAAARATDRAAGTNVSGAYPLQSDGMPGNPPGTEVTRTTDRVAGTNVSGAYPLQSDGMPGNPPGTAAGRTVDRALGTAAPTPSR